MVYFQASRTIFFKCIIDKVRIPLLLRNCCWARSARIISFRNREKRTDTRDSINTYRCVSLIIVNYNDSREIACLPGFEDSAKEKKTKPNKARRKIETTINFRDTWANPKTRVGWVNLKWQIYRHRSTEAISPMTYLQTNIGEAWNLFTRSRDEILPWIPRTFFLLLSTVARWNSFVSLWSRGYR